MKADVPADACIRRDHGGHGLPLRLNENYALNINQKIEDKASFRTIGTIAAEIC
jgi:hypothetical protein